MIATAERRLAVLERLIDQLDRPPIRWDSPTDLARDIGLTLDPWQSQILESVSTRLIILGPRQSGKTTTTAVLGLHVALSIPEALVLLIAPAERQSMELARTIRRMAGSVGLMTAERTDRVAMTALSASRLEFANGSRVIALPGASESTVRGYPKPDLIVIDEAARLSEETYAAIRPALVASPNGRLVLLSTPYLKSGTFHKTWHDPSPVWERIRVRLEDVPRYSTEFLDEERRTLPHWVFSREYLGQFSDDETTLFSSELIAAAMDDTLEALFLEDDDASNS